MVSARPRVLAWPIGDRLVASSRLRLYAPLAELATELDVNIIEPGSAERRRPVGLLDDVDLCYLQKDARPPARALVEDAARRGIPVVYDLDDDIGCWHGMDERGALTLASAVVVDSPHRAADVTPWASRTTAIPCMIDLAGDHARWTHRPPGALASVGTFGNRSSLEGTREYLEAVPSSMQVRVIGPPDARSAFPGVDYRDFTLGSFVADVLASDVALLAHDRAEAARKDENRLVMALSCQRAAFVSPTPSYQALLREIDAEDLVVETPEDLGRALATLEPGQLATLADAGHSYVWQTYGPRAISARLLAVFLEALASG
jgi:hypothetical protein